ncbi:hypothetical protein UA08_02425 [Talaromyces atroroseus]|uniref:F-box domain-containing protein n=1 Tax=Talaromyces atroroseus TaxID=1441469 RepID=A0A225AK29_TALAT|nr:hypothetical protein UA08_02425 [Talaromyces atroroseus]OKL61901.1 hypothetical protein UA08_02425 [Talaromyces atroroseus]
MSSNIHGAPMAPLWWTASSGQTHSNTLPQKPSRWSDNWDLATEPFPEFATEPHSIDGTSDIIALNASDHRSATPTSHSKDHNLREYLSSSPCISEDTASSENDTSSPGSSSLDLSRSQTPSSESEWQSNRAATHIHTEQIPAANRAPPEILDQIYGLLSPRDFDNARRTCSQWMRASLQQALLESMLKRAGWWDAWRRDCQTYRPANGVEQSLVWRLSKRFATECVLSGRKVNVEKSGFLPTGMVDFGQLSRESLPKESPGLSRDMFTGSAPRLTAALRDPAFSRSIKFSVSVCGHYVLIATGCMIYVYYLGNRNSGDTLPCRLSDSRTAEAILRDNDLDILPVSSIGCPYEVLSAAIDTSTPKFVIAALLRGRVGMICDIKGVPVHLPTEHASPLLHQGSSTTEQLSTDQVQNISEFREVIVSSAIIEHALNPDRRPTLTSRSVSSCRVMNRLTRAPRKYFHDICSLEDPPRSVSICPGRRCVAFGCGSGIELHWVDEKTQEDSRKLFPLSQPAEVLHFLPSRVEIDEASKLRLISSLAGPGASGCQCYRAANGEDVICQFHLSSRVNSFTHWTPRKNGRLSLVKATHCHHYRAMPVNDGLHILFIEPVTGLLCIGSDAPIGGPTNLTRAMICIPPSDGLESKEERIPTVFAVGSDLSWGLRIVAAYQDRLVLYTVPVDVYNVLRRERELQGDNVMGDSDLARDWFLDNERNSKRRGSLAQNQNGDWEFLLRVSYRPTAMLWPLKIYGKEIGRMDKVVDFSVQTSSGGVRVWAFGSSGEARIFDIDTHTSKTRPAADVAVKSFNVSSDGSIGSASFKNRAESGLLSPLPVEATRKRKHLSQPAAFDRKLLSVWKDNNTLSTNNDCGVDGFEVSSSTTSLTSPSRRTTASIGRNSHRQSFAACIMDLKIPELGAREGLWTPPNRAATAPSTPGCDLDDSCDTAEFHDIASYDPQEIRKFFTVWSTSSPKPSAGRWR